MTIERVVFVLCAAIGAGCVATSDVVATGAGTYEIRVPTQKMPQIRLTFTAIGDTPGEPIRVPDQATVEEAVKQQAREYCAKLKQTMMQTGGGFDMGTGFFFDFKCVPPSTANP
jgi:hypothetical protein